MTEETLAVLKDPHHQNIITKMERSEGDNNQKNYKNKTKTLRLTTPPKIRDKYIIGRRNIADLMLTNNKIFTKLIIIDLTAEDLLVLYITPYLLII